MSKPPVITIPTVYLREWRKHLGLSQEEIGRRLGKTRGQISEIETGIRQWDLALLAQMSAALDLHWTFLLGRPGEALTIEMLLRQIPKDQLPQVVRILETFAAPPSDSGSTKKKFG